MSAGGYDTQRTSKQARCRIYMPCKETLFGESMAWNEIPSDEVINKTAEAIKSRGINVVVVTSGKDARKKLIEIIPKGAQIANGSSTTLHQIGYIDYLKSGNHGWKNYQDLILKETDPEKQADLRRLATTADYFVGSVNAIAETGELVIVNATGSANSAYPFAAKNLIIVAGVQKIVPALQDAMKRVREYVFPLEDARMMKEYGIHSSFGKWVIIEKELNKGRITLILVKEKLGF